MILFFMCINICQASTKKNSFVFFCVNENEYKYTMCIYSCVCGLVSYVTVAFPLGPRLIIINHNAPTYSLQIKSSDKYDEVLLPYRCTNWQRSYYCEISLIFGKERSIFVKNLKKSIFIWLHFYALHDCTAY